MLNNLLGFATRKINLVLANILKIKVVIRFIQFIQLLGLK